MSVEEYRREERGISKGTRIKRKSSKGTYLWCLQRTKTARLIGLHQLLGKEQKHLAEFDVKLVLNVQSVTGLG